MAGLGKVEGETVVATRPGGSEGPPHPRKVSDAATENVRRALPDTEDRAIARAEGSNEPCPRPQGQPTAPQVEAPQQTEAPAHSIAGSVPWVTSPHVPFGLPVRTLEHAWQAVPQAEVQQYPSAQLPLAHWLASVQTAPRQPPHVAFPQSICVSPGSSVPFEQL